MSQQTKSYRIEFKGSMSGIWMFYMQFKSLKTAKQTVKSVHKANPNMQLRIREINLLDLSIFKLFEGDL